MDYDLVARHQTDLVGFQKPHILFGLTGHAHKTLHLHAGHGHKGTAPIANHGAEKYGVPLMSCLLVDEALQPTVRGVGKDDLGEHDHEAAHGLLGASVGNETIGASHIGGHVGIGEQTLHIVLVAPLDAEHEPLGQVAQVVGGESISDSSVVCGHMGVDVLFCTNNANTHRHFCLCDSIKVLYPNYLGTP